MKILVSHVGFTPGGAKYCVVEGGDAAEFQVVETGTGRVAYSGRLAPVQGDWGPALVGEFSALKAPGTYEVRAGEAHSGPFAIGDGVYDDAIHKTVTYFAAQRCGPSTTGYHAPCHLDDGRRLDNNEHLDVTGGWHDACDVRKWVGATIYGMAGLARVAEVYQPQWDKGGIAEELRWGNRYFLAMQAPDGYVMSYCGGDDGNRWTDNQVGDADDRPIHTEPADAPAQFFFVLAQAAVVRLTRDQDPGYARKCADAANRCLDYCLKHNWNYTNALGAGILACVEMHRTFGEDRYRDLAAGYAKKLLALQVRDEGAPVRGFFIDGPGKREPDRQISRGCLQLLGLCALLERFPEHADAPAWRDAVALYCRRYLAPMAARTPYGIVPYGLYAGGDPGGDRRVGEYWYRWFMEPGRRWWVGINANVASAGVGLAKAGRLLNDPGLTALAQRQLDWVVGANPFDASTMTGVGRNQPKLFVTGEFRPATPPIPGAVMNGIGGTVDDRPDIKPGSWQTCEYWTPMVCYTMWLMSELEAPPPAMAFPGARWEERAPEAEGVDGEKLKAAFEYLKENAGPDGINETVVVRDGYLIWQGPNPDKKHGVWSLTKSFTSTVLGLLIEDGKATLATRAKDVLPSMAGAYPDVSLRHFTTMTSGYYAVGDEPKGSYVHGPSATWFEPGQTPLFAPGTKYAYWDSAMNQFGNILAHIAGEPIEDLFRRRIAEPIGMGPKGWDWGDFGKIDGVVVNGGSGNSSRHIFITARELARFGHLYLNRGNWNGRQLISADWVAQATSVQVPAETPLGHPASADGRGVYGFNWWVNGVKPDGTRRWPHAPAGTYAAAGFNNNDLFVIPEWRMVIVRLGLDENAKKISDEVYDTFLARVGEALGAASAP